MFLLIRSSLARKKKANCISIHPMFLLISGHAVKNYVRRNFNTSHVSINHPSLCELHFYHKDFNTSHVSINLVRLTVSMFFLDISIHPMFLLINTRHGIIRTKTVISIHPMFLLIATVWLAVFFAVGFQYIPCFY